jgi:hypothetical protein
VRPNLVGEVEDRVAEGSQRHAQRTIVDVTEEDWAFVFLAGARREDQLRQAGDVWSLGQGDLRDQSLVETRNGEGNLLPIARAHNNARSEATDSAISAALRAVG